MMFFIILIVSILILGLFSWFASKYNWFNNNNNEPQTDVEPEICCGAHEVCLKDNLQIINPKPIYYDDEELDVFANRDPQTYTDQECQLFEEIFETLDESELSGWLCSLQIRSIQLPEFIYEQALNVVSERRNTIQ